MIFFSAGLIFSQVIGLFRSPISSPAIGVIPGYHYSTLSKEKLSKVIDENENLDFEWIQKINEAIYLSTAHGEAAMLRFEHSWVLWGLSKWKGDPLRYSQNPSKILQADAAICSQKARLIVSIAENKNVKARLISLDGHVVAELFVGGKWFVADPDWGLVFPFDAIDLVNVKNEPLIENSLEERGYSDVEINVYKNVIRKGYVHRHQIYEAHESKPELIERWSVVLSWLLPLISLFTGLGLLMHSVKKDKNTNQCAD